MKSETLVVTNPYLRYPEQRRRLLSANVCSSSAIEGIVTVAEKAITCSRGESLPPEPRRRRKSSATRS